MIRHFKAEFVHAIFRFAGLCLLAVTVAGHSLLSAQSTAPNSAVTDQVTAFYRFHFSHEMGFARDAVKARTAWFTPDLLKLCYSYFSRPAVTDQVPDVDGDPFTNSQEYPNTFAIGAPKQIRSTALMPVTFRWSDGRERTLSVALVERNRKWLIDDFQYPDGSSLRSLISKGKP